MAPVAGIIEETEETWLKAGAAVAQFCGTDNMPSVAARPTLADMAALDIPAELNAPVPGTTPLPSNEPQAWSWLVNTLAAGLSDFISELAEPSIVAPVADIDAEDPVPEATLVAELSAVDDEVTLESDESSEVEVDDVVAVAVDATPVTVFGTATVEVVNGVDSAELIGEDTAEVSGEDTADVSGETVCALVPAEVVATWATAVACSDRPAELVVGSGVWKEGNVAAAADDPA